MKLQRTLILLFLLTNILISIVYSIHLNPKKGLDKKANYKLLVCKSFDSNKRFLTLKPLDKSNKYNCKKVSSNKVKEYLNITPQKIKQYYKLSREKSKMIHKVEIKNSLLYINILKKYLDNYICYSMYKSFKKHKCSRFYDRCKKTFKKNNYQIYSTVDLINIFKKVSGTINKKRKVRKFKSTVLTLHIDYQDLDWAYFIFDRIHKKFKIFNDFSVVLFKTKGRIYLYKFSSRYYRIQLNNLRLNPKNFTKKKTAKIGKYRQKFIKLRNIIKSSHYNSKQFIISKKLKRFKNNIKVCKVYEELYNYYMSSTDKKYKLLYYFDPIIDIQFGTKYSRVHYLNRLITFKLKINVKKEGTSSLSKIKTTKSKNTFSNYLKSFSKNPDENLNKRKNGLKKHNFDKKNLY